MKKVFIFLITILSVIMPSMVVNADTASFYEGEYINFYVNRVKGGIIHYNRMRVYRRNGDNMFSYCIEPFVGTNPSSIYESNITTSTLSNDQMKRIKDIIHFGYGYGNHSSMDWYALTQLMVWKEADPNNDFYFTDYLNGNRINILNQEMNEINSLINSYYTLPSFSNMNVDIVEDQSITLNDTSNVLSNYISNSNFVHISNNNLIIDGLKEGVYNIELLRNDNSNSNIPLFYNSSDSQNMVIVGGLEAIKVNLTINVKKTGIEITKMDTDTNSIEPSGNAELIGAVYELMDSNKNTINEMVIGDDNKSYINNIEYGKYFIREKKPGKGYTLDENLYEINIDKNTPIIELSLNNKVIEKEIEIHKFYGENNNYLGEKGISFELFDDSDNLIDTITTDDNGVARIVLPYGKYKFKQINTTDGYNCVDDFIIDVISNEKEIKELYDYKIKVPYTYSEGSLNIFGILIIIIELLYGKKKLFS